MNHLSVLIVGSGGREHALAWKLRQSPQVDKIFIAPGNAGTAVLGQNVPIGIEDIAQLRQFALDRHIGLTVVGPEIPLALGIVDSFQAAGLPIFGPSRAAAQLETSKAFAKQFMQETGIPTAEFATFHYYDQARAYIWAHPRPMVVKASGLAAGKGVIVCNGPGEGMAALKQIMLDRVFGASGDEVVIEERLTGPELSVLAFCDGQTAVPLAPARDHKRAYDGDLGPNTGGMGVFAPPPDIAPPLISHVMDTIIGPTVRGMADRGTPYVGILYAGLMLTADGPQVLEFNGRFGDPETQVILPLLDGDLAEIMLACIGGTLSPEMVRRKAGACAAVVMAAPGYPDSYPKGLPITGLPQVPEDVLVFHAGTKVQNGQIVSDGGRVLAVTAWGGEVQTAVSRAYAGVSAIHFAGAHYRKDIGPQEQTPQSAYAQAGVDLAAGHRATELMKTAVHSTFNADVLSHVGHFGGLFDITRQKTLTRPVLVASTDGVGTKTMVAAKLGRWDTIGQDIVNHCLNDILVQGAKPLFFLDYVAAARLDPEQIALVVRGAAQACHAVGCALLGGETAEMPGIYQPGQIDLVGTMVGVVEHERLIDGRSLQAGDAILGLPSSGLHTNGYTLARTVLSSLDWHTPQAELGQSIGESLLAVHRPYLHQVEALWRAGVTIHGLAHITGGGLIDNPPRIFPAGLGAILYRQRWPKPPIFHLIQQLGNISDAEMAHVFNLGLGMLVMVPPDQVTLAQTAVPEALLVGEMVAGEQTVQIQL